MTNTKLRRPPHSTRPRCPLPVLKAKRAPNPLVAGEVLEIPATNRSATKNFEHFCHITGSEKMHYCGLFAAQSAGGQTGNSIMQSRKLRCAVPKEHSACPQHRAPQPTAPCS